MNGIHWTGSDRKLIDANEIEDLATEVADEILNEQYDGYKCLNKHLAQAIAYHLCRLTHTAEWYVHTDAKPIEEGNQYLIWVDR